MLTPKGYDPCEEGIVDLTPSQIAQIVWEYADRSLSAAPGGAVGPDALSTDADIYSTALVGGTARCCAKVVLWNGIFARIANVTTVTYSVFRLGENGQRTAVSGHTAISVEPAQCLFDSLQSDALASSYNFMHVLDVSTHPAFAAAGEYLVEFQLTPVLGQIILVRFRINVI